MFKDTITSSWIWNLCCARARTSNELKISIEAVWLACPETKGETHLLSPPLFITLAQPNLEIWNQLLVIVALNIPLMKGTVLKRLDICYDFGTFTPFSTFIWLHNYCLSKNQIHLHGYQFPFEVSCPASMPWGSPTTLVLVLSRFWGVQYLPFPSRLYHPKIWDRRQHHTLLQNVWEMV